MRCQIEEVRKHSHYFPYMRSIQNDKDRSSKLINISFVKIAFSSSLPSDDNFYVFRVN